MSVLNQQLFTKTFNTETTFSVIPDYGVKQYTIKVISGTATLLGGKTIAGVESDAITLSEGDVFSGNGDNTSCSFILTVASASIVEVAAT